jgi:calcium-dependent protein kinase
MESNNENDLKINKETFITINKGDITQFYEVIKKIGEGAYGKIYKVKNKQSGDIRAMKQIIKSKITDMTKFQTEIKILSMVDHPNIVRLYEVIEDDKYYNLLQELCTGGELYKKYQATQLKEKEIAHIFNQIMSAVAYCHEKGIAHRDLKLENILFVSEHPDSPIKVIDFGFSVFFQKKKDDKEKNNDGIDTKKYGIRRMKSKVGTLYYISPEIIKGNYDEKCDIWACGVILYILLCGYPPFSGNNDKEVYNLITQIKYDFDKETWKNISKYAKDLIKKMLTPAKNRYTAQQVLACKWLEVKLKDANNEKPFLDYKYIHNYKKYNKFKQIILTFIASRLSSEESKKITNIFCSIDEEKKGFITFENFRKYIVDQYDIDDLVENEEELRRGFEGIDIDCNNRIDYTEFLAANLDRSIFLKQEKLKEAFRAFDINDTGAIKKEDIIRFLKLDELQDKNSIANAIIEENDFDKDGKINFKDFMKVMEKHDEEEDNDLSEIYMKKKTE